jgi:hypothetical protein
MAQVVLSVVGSYFGPIGSAIGAAIGGLIDKALFGPKNKAPAVGDLSTPKVEYGSEIPRLAGTNVTAGALGWMSEKRPTAVESGGKGGGGDVVGYTYTADIIFILGQHDQEAVWKAVAIPRVWRNGELVYSARAGADPETYAASDGTTAWDSIELMDGGPTQLPPDVYEAAVTTLLAKGWRGQNCVLLRNARFGSSTMPPAYKFEVITDGTPSDTDALTLLQSRFIGADADDESAYNWGSPTISATGATVSDGEIEISNPDGGLHYVSYAPAGLYPNGTDALTFEAIIRNDNSPASSKGLFLTIGAGTYEFYWPSNGPPAYLKYNAVAQTAGDAGIGVNVHVALVLGSTSARVYVDGALLYSNAGDFRPGSGDAISVVFGNSAVGGSKGPASIGFRVRQEEVYTGAIFAPPTVIPPPDGSYTAWAAGTVDLADLVEANCRRANIPAALIDVTDLVGIPVRGFASAGGVRAAIEQLMQVFHFGAVCDDMLRFVLRGGASAASIPFADMGAGFDSAAEEAIAIEFGNDDEVPRKLSLSYINLNADHDAGSVIGDRGTGNIQRLPTAQVGVVMTPSEAQKVADAWALDGRGAATTIKLPLTEFYAERQPTDVVTLTDRQGISYRARIVAESWSIGLHEHDLVLDDASVFTQAGIATDDTTPNINVPLPAAPVLLLLDIPILRDADDSYGLYACVTADGSFKGCSVRRSRDGGTTYTEVGTLGNRAVAGTATALGASTTWGWDDASSMTVTLSAGAGGTLSSATKAAVEANAELNVAAVGVHGRWEIVRFATASLIAADTYLLSGFLRGQLGTEHNRANHAAGDTFVLLRSTGMIRIAGDATDVGVERKYKAVPTLGSEAAATAVAFTSAEQGLKPYAPVDVRQDVTDGATVVSWNRRSRLSTPPPYTTQPPLGEASESYDVELYDALAALVSTETVTEPEWSAASAAAFENFLVPMTRIVAISGEQVGVREDSTPNFTFVRQTIAGGLIDQSAVLGSLVYQTTNDGDELYAATADLSAGSPSFYIAGKVKRVTRTALSTVAATYTAATPGDIHGIAFDGTDIWVSEFYGGNLRKLNKTTLASSATYAVDPGIRSLLHDSGSLWITRDYDDEVIEWDIATLAEVNRFSVASGPSSLLIVGSLLFIRCGYVVEVRNKTTGALVESHAATHTGTSRLLEFGAYVAAMAGDYSFLLLDKTTGALVSTLSCAITYGGTAYSFFRSLAGIDGTTIYLTLGGPGLSNQTVGFDLDALDLVGYTLKVHQNSAIVGRGYVAELTL